MKRIKIGDVVEVETQKGLAYFQFAMRVKQWGCLIRILPNLYTSRPTDFHKLVSEKERFVTFFPLQQALNQGIFRVVSNEPMPDWATQLPFFRAAGYRDKNGKVHDWWLTDGEREWLVKKLTPEQKRMPIKQVVNDTALIARIEQGWTPETDKWSQD